jgi:hypothetical protein
MEVMSNLDHCLKENITSNDFLVDCGHIWTDFLRS